MADRYQQLQQLKSLLDSGVLSQEEFDAEKKNILETPEVHAKPTRKPGFFSSEAIKQREEDFNNLPQAEQERRKMTGIIILTIIGVGFFMVLFLLFVVFGVDGTFKAISNMFER